MNRKIIEQVKEQIFSRVDMYRSLRKREYNEYLEMFCDDDFVLEEYFIEKETPVSIDAEIKILIANESRYIVEVYFEKSMYENFYFSLRKQTLVFDYETNIQYPEPELKTQYYMSELEQDEAKILKQLERDKETKPMNERELNQYQEKHKYDIELFPKELIPDDLRKWADMEPFVMCASFEIKETEFSQYEKDRATGFRKKKIFRLNAKCKSNG